MEGLCGALGVGIRFSKRRGKALKIEVGEVVPDEDLFKEVFSSVWRLFLHCRKWRMDEKSRLRERFSRPCRWSSVHVLSFKRTEFLNSHLQHSRGHVVPLCRGLLEARNETLPRPGAKAHRREAADSLEAFAFGGEERKPRAEGGRVALPRAGGRGGLRWA